MLSALPRTDRYEAVTMDSSRDPVSWLKIKIKKIHLHVLKNLSNHFTILFLLCPLICSECFTALIHS